MQKALKALFIGGTGTISAAISKRCIQEGWELYLLNRGNRVSAVPEGAKTIIGDIRNQEEIRQKLEGMEFDVVADFIAYDTADVQRDIELFQGKTKQYFFISSASAYQKPLSMPLITEGTPLVNPFWQYSRDKIAGEELLMAECRKNGFPVTIIRPSHTYSDQKVPLPLAGTKGSFSVLERMRRGKKVIVPGDGLTLWTLTHADDFAVAFCGLMGNIHAIGEVYHITGDECLTWNQVYRAAAEALGVEAKIVHIASETLAELHGEYYGSLLGDKSNCAIFDNGKIKRAVPAFNAVIRFDQGVRRTVESIYSHEEFQTPDPEFDAWCDGLIAAYEKAVEGFPRYEG